MKIINEILNDYSDYCHKKLVQEFGGYSSATYDPIYLYQRYKCRIIEPTARSVFEAKHFSVPHKYEVAYKEIIDAIESGSCLKKYQSRNLKRLDYNDDMLSHWGIQHLHLGQNLEADGFVKRTSDLLFVHFSNKEAHILGIFSHGAWCDLDLIEIMHENWANHLSAFKKNTHARPLTEVEYKTSRKKHANATVTVQDGTEYLCPGMGVTANGSPIYAILNTNNTIFMFNKAFELIEENIEKIAGLDPQERSTDVVTIGMEFLHDSKTIAYKIKETGFVFILEG